MFVGLNVNLGNTHQNTNSPIYTEYSWFNVYLVDYIFKALNVNIVNTGEIRLQTPISPFS